MCNPDLYKHLLIPVAGLFTGLIVAVGVAAGLATNPWTTTFSGAAAIAIGVAAGLAAGLVATLSGILAAFETWWRCITSSDPRTAACEGRFLTARAILASAIALMLTSIYPALAAAGAVSWIPGVAVAPLTVIIIALSGSAVSVGSFLGVALGVESCIRETHGSLTMPITSRSGSGQGSGSGGSGGRPPVMRLSPHQFPALFGRLETGKWFRRWPSGTVIDGSLGPDVCPICLYTIFLSDGVNDIAMGYDGRVFAISSRDITAVTFNGKGVVVSNTPLPQLPRDSTPQWQEQGLTIQGLITENGKLRAVIAGTETFDWEPYIVREPVS